jgi:hypothetical protein
LVIVSLLWPRAEASPSTVWGQFSSTAATKEATVSPLGLFFSSWNADDRHNFSQLYFFDKLLYLRSLQAHVTIGLNSKNFDSLQQQIQSLLS